MVTVIAPIKKVFLSVAAETRGMIIVNFCLCRQGYQSQGSLPSMSAEWQEMVCFKVGWLKCLSSTLLMAAKSVKEEKFIRKERKCCTPT